MRRALTATLVTCGLALVAAACGGSGSKATSTAAAGGTSAAGGPAQKIALWVGWSDRELDVFKKVVGDYDTAHPEVDDRPRRRHRRRQDHRRAAQRRRRPTRSRSFTSSNVGAYCSSGGWIDLAPTDEAGRHRRLDLPGARRSTTRSTTASAARCRSSPTPTASTTTRTCSTKAGATAPPKTVTELTALAKKLTDAQGRRIARRGRVRPVLRLLPEHARRRTRRCSARTWQDADGNSTLATDPAWAKMLTWQKELVDFYGYDNLVKWQAGVGDEFSASNAFETGKLAMNLDGEWRVAFIAQRAPRPAVRHGAVAGRRREARPVRRRLHQRHDHRHPEGVEAPGSRVAARQVPDDRRQGAGRARRTACATCPRPRSSAKSPDLTRPERSRPSSTSSTTRSRRRSRSRRPASGYVDLTQSFFAEWQAGKVSDLAGGLAKLDEQIDAQKKQAEAGQAP